jgi:hypothetical protein
MTRIALAATIAAVLGTAQLAAALGPLCCACLPGAPGWATGGGSINRTAVDALFCSQAPPANPAELEMRCLATPGYDLECIPNLPGTSCVGEFAEGGIQCPAAGAPAAGSATLLTLAVTLTAAGMLAARRQRRS